MTVGVGETERTAEPEGALARPVLRRVLAAVVLTSWLAWAVPSWMSSLQEVQPHEFVADVQAGRVTGFVSVANVQSKPLEYTRLSVPWEGDVPGADSEGRPTDGPPRQMLYSVDGGVRLRWLADYVPTVGDLDPFAALSASGARPFTPETFPPSRDWAAFPALLSIAVALFSIVTLPPTRGTRPFWILTGPMVAGVGIVVYAVAELWWRRPTPAVVDSGGSDANADDADGEQRLRWWHGLVVAIGGGLLVSALVAVIT